LGPMGIVVVADYDGASIDVESISGDVITLALKSDPPCALEGGKAFAQHFCFTIAGAAGRDLELRIGNAATAMCSEAFYGHAPCCAFPPAGLHVGAMTSPRHAAGTSACAPTGVATETGTQPLTPKKTETAGCACRRRTTA
jgi:hypothetical protein